VGAAPRGLDREDVIEVDVRHHRQQGDRRHALEGVERVAVRDGDAHDLAARVGEGLDLRECGFDVSRVGVVID